MMETKPDTVSRGSYFGGLIIGAGVLAIGLTALAQFDVGGWQIPLEMAVVGVAMLVTTGIWKRSVVSSRRE